MGAPSMGWHCRSVNVGQQGWPDCFPAARVVVGRNHYQLPSIDGASLHYFLRNVSIPASDVVALMDPRRQWGLSRRVQ